MHNEAQALTTIVRDADTLACVGLAESVTVTLKVVLPVVVGVPLRTPVLDNAKPGGRLAALALQVYAGVPPLAVSVVVYGTLIVPAGSEVLVMVNGPPLPVTEIVTGLVLEFLTKLESVIVTLRIVAPTTVGVPETTPALEMRKVFAAPAGEPVSENV